MATKSHNLSSPELEESSRKRALPESPTIAVSMSKRQMEDSNSPTEEGKFIFPKSRKGKRQDPRLEKGDLPYQETASVTTPAEKFRLETHGGLTPYRALQTFEGSQIPPLRVTLLTAARLVILKGADLLSAEALRLIAQKGLGNIVLTSLLSTPRRAKGVLMNYPARFDVEVINDHGDVESARRCIVKKRGRRSPPEASKWC